MRARADAKRIRALAAELGKVAPEGTRIYLTGGGTAVLEGWRASTIDVELASPLDFLLELPEWRERSRSQFKAGAVEVFDFDLYSQALSKIEPGFDLDRADVREMLERKLIDPERLRELFAAIEPDLHRFPAVDPASLQRGVEAATA